MSTFRAAYIAAEAGSTDGGILLTTEDQADMPDADLIAAAEKVATDIGADGEIVIGDWRE